MTKPRMHYYSVFGGCLCSELEFPDLSPTLCRRPDWTVRQAIEPLIGSDETPLGEQVIGEEAVRFYRSASGFRLQYSNLGTVYISFDGSRITWHPGPEGLPEFGRALVLGPALALASSIRLGFSVFMGARSPSRTPGWRSWPPSSTGSPPLLSRCWPLGRSCCRTTPWRWMLEHRRDPARGS